MKIDHTNYSTKLKRSANPRGAGPNGNVYINLSTNQIQLITADELPTVDFGSGAEANPLTTAEKVTLRALYNFESWRRRTDNDLQQYLRYIEGDFRYAGSYNLVNGASFADSDHLKIADSGFSELSGRKGTAAYRVWHGIRSLVDIRPGTVPYYTFITPPVTEAALQAATWYTMAAGDINEVVQVYGDGSHGNFDHRNKTLVIRVRSWGYLFGETDSVVTGIVELAGFSSGYGVGESLNAQNTFNISNVYGVGAISPFNGMYLEKLASPYTGTGFNEGNGSYTWRLHNPNGGSANQCAAFLDAVALQDTNINNNSANTGTYNGKKGRVWYSRDASGRVVTASIGGAGLFIDGLSVSEKQNVVQTDNAGTGRTYPYFPDVQISVGSAVSDPLAWYRVMFAAGHDTNSAVTVKDSSGNDVTGNVVANASGGKVSFPFPFDTDTLGGDPGTAKDIVVVVEGDGGVAQAIATATITRTPVIAITCAPALETNA